MTDVIFMTVYPFLAILLPLPAERRNSLSDLFRLLLNKFLNVTSDKN